MPPGMRIDEIAGLDADRFEDMKFTNDERERTKMTEKPTDVETDRVSRREMCIMATTVSAMTGIGAAAGLAWSSATKAASATTPRGTMRVTGPIPQPPDSKPFGATAEGSRAAALLKEYDYVEEEYFAEGTCNVYGLGVETKTIKSGKDFPNVGALSKVVRSGVPYRTRMLVVRPRNLNKFSGNVHAIAFHNIGGQSSVERHLLRNGDAWIGIEASNGTKFGPEETLSGGVAHLQKFNKARYGELSLPGGRPEDWPDSPLAISAGPPRS